MMTAFFLTGMGADSSLYGDPWRRLPGTRFPEWPEYRGETTLRQIALRVIEQESITGEDIVGGTSLGAMVAAEIARELRVRALILVAGAVQKEEINLLLRHLIPMAEWTPFKFTQWLAAGLWKSHMIRMYRRSDPAFIRATCLALRDWQGLGETDIPVYRLHGTRDLVITRPAAGCERIRGGHRIVLTHAEKTAEWAGHILRQLREPQEEKALQDD